MAKIYFNACMTHCQITTFTLGENNDFIRAKNTTTTTAWQYNNFVQP